MAKSTSKAVRITNVVLALFTVAGMILSVYAYHVETSVHSDPTFKALCDISEHMSCSKVFSSRYGTGFGLIGLIFGQDSPLNQPNSVYGMIFYVLQALLTFRMSYTVAVMQVVMGAVACIGCVYLAYILVFILYDLCVVCVSTYILNTTILVCCVVKLRAIQNMETIKKQKDMSKKAN